MAKKVPIYKLMGQIHILEIAVEMEKKGFGNASFR